MMKPGPELDAAVAEAIGYTYAGFCRKFAVYFSDGEHLLSRSCEPGVDFRPSTDANDALLAAERVCQADKPDEHDYQRHPRGLNLTVESDFVYHDHSATFRDNKYGTELATAEYARTLPHAICLAIVRLAEENR